MLELTLGIWFLICSINSDVNGQITYLSDMEHCGKREAWTYQIDGLGDCEDFALEKQKRLHEQGIQSRIAICITKKYKFHAVLIVRTDRGDFVLTQHNVIKHPEETNYIWYKIEGRDGKWYGISLE